MDTLSFSCEELTESLWDEAVPLLHSHWKEVAHYGDIPLAPNLEFYRLSQEAGVLRMFTARDRGDLVGYALFFVRPAPHYRHSIQAAMDVLYMDPAMRGWGSIRFLKFCDASLADEGVQVVSHHIKIAHDLGSVLCRMGYEAVETIYTKRLDQPVVRHQAPDLSAFREASDEAFV